MTPISSRRTTRSDSGYNGSKGRLASRRTVLKATGGFGLAALAAPTFACSRGENQKPATGDRSGLLTAPSDTSDRAQHGGLLPAYLPSDTPGFDGMVSSSAQAAIHNDFSYARLVNFHVFNKAKGETIDQTLDPYAAESWEVSPDGTEYTFRLRADGGLDPRAPTNGRVLDAEDVVFAWNRFRTGHRSRALLLHDLNPNAPIVSVTAIGSRTVKMKLAYPAVSVLAALAFNFYLGLQPREAEGGFDPVQTMRGSGPWLLTDYQPGVSFSYRRNPNFYRKDRPYLDGIDAPIISEYAQGLAQLKAGRLYSYSVRQEDIVEARRNSASLEMLLQDLFNQAAGGIAFFNFKAGSVFRDERLRQAMSLLIDRDLYAETVFNVAKFEAMGLPVRRRWATVLPVGDEGFWLDPRSKEFGANARFFQYDPGEARKLVQAAAGQRPVKDTLTFIGGNEYGPDYGRDVQVLQSMWQANGDFEFKNNVVDYDSVFLPRYSINGPNRSFEGGGVAVAGVAPFPEPDLLLGEWYMPGGTYYKFEPDYPNDGRWDSLMKAQRTELDADRRRELLKEIQRYHAEKAYTIHRPAFTLGYALKQKWLANAGTFFSRSANTFSGGPNPSTSGLHWWIDRAGR